MSRWLSADDWKKRQTLLDVGQTYRVLLAPKPPSLGSPKTGELLTLRQVGYSRYDNAHIYYFDAPDGSERQYWLPDDTQIMRLAATFELANDT